MSKWGCTQYDVSKVQAAHQVLHFRAPTLQQAESFRTWKFCIAKAH